MIVRDEEENLPHCLESVRGLFDEIVVVDTGSVDRTKEIAREFGAKVFDFVWVDDFAAARNEALAHATGDYAFWLDADDVVEPRERSSSAQVSEPVARSEASRLGRSLALPRPAAYVVRCAAHPSPGRHERRDGRRSCPAVSASAGCALDLSGSRADLAVAEAGEGPGALDRLDGAAYRLRRPCPAGSEARPRHRGSSSASWKSGPMIRLCCSTWVRSPSNGASGPRRLGFSNAAWPARLRATRSCASCMR